ncbi:hypothetical protein KOW79_014204 [Hemibagrus wyckioides]|uniref:G-protein coupled receptors family 2 profile 2 domain-containing protein n=1 Tax=Hemibagrus wyckioides TaxID=337641 RepID=A0A9D3NKG1_9TELE|nr:hypothetical protein KOW79_014204 [Hemibagrus wyckioides]
MQLVNSQVLPEISDIVEFSYPEEQVPLLRKTREVNTGKVEYIVIVEVNASEVILFDQVKASADSITPLQIDNITNISGLDIRAVCQPNNTQYQCTCVDQLHNDSCNNSQHNNSCNNSHHNNSCNNSQHNNSCNNSHHNNSCNNSQHNDSCNNSHHNNSCNNSQHNNSCNNSHHNDSCNNSHHNNSCNNSQHNNSCNNSQHNNSCNNSHHNNSCNNSQHNDSCNNSQHNNSCNNSHHNNSCNNSQHNSCNNSQHNNSCNNSQHNNSFNIAVSLLIADICFIIGAAVVKQEGPCSTATFFMHFFYLALFFWMLLSALLLLYRTLMVFSRMTRGAMMGIGFTVGYGAPLIIAVITVASTAGNKGYIQQDYNCWLNWSKTKALLAFVIPALTIVAINFLVLIVVLFKMMRRGVNASTQPDEKHSLVVIAKCVAILTPLFGLTWGFGIGTLVSSNFGIHVVFAFLNSLQVREALAGKFSLRNLSSGHTRSTSAGPTSSSGFPFMQRLRQRYVYNVQQNSGNTASASNSSYAPINT